MNSLNGLIFLAALLALGDCIECTKAHDKLLTVKKHRDVTEALNLLHDIVAGYMSVDARCRRYAILIWMFESGNPLYDTTVEHMASRHEYFVNQRINQFGSVKLSSMFIDTIDKYRSTKLAPPIIDLIDCLREFDIYSVKKFLSDKELIMIETLYREVLKNPDIKFDLSNINLVGFHPAFLTTLRNLFSAQVNKANRPSQEAAPPIEMAGQPSTSNMPAEQRFRGRKPILNIEEKLYRSRERDRLRQRRLRILRPNETRERERARHYKRRVQVREAKRRDQLQSKIGESDEAILQRQMQRYIKLQVEQQQQRLEENHRLLRWYGRPGLPLSGRIGPTIQSEAGPFVLESLPLEQHLQQQPVHKPPEPVQSGARSVTSFTSLLQHMEQQAAPANSCLPQMYPARDTPGPLMMQSVPQSVPSPSNDSYFQHLNRTYRQERANTRLSGGLVSPVGIFEAGIQDQSKMYEDSVSSLNQFDDTDAVVQSFLNQTSAEPGLGFLDEEKAALWQEFDKEYQRSGKGAPR